MKKKDKPPKLRVFNVITLIMIALFIFGIFCTVYFAIQIAKYEDTESESSVSMSFAEYADPAEISSFI